MNSLRDGGWPCHVRRSSPRKRFVQNLHLIRMLCAGQKSGLNAEPSVSEITPGWLGCTSRLRRVQKLLKTAWGRGFDEFTKTCFGANSFRNGPFRRGKNYWHRRCDEFPVAESSSQFKQKKSMNNQTTVSSTTTPVTPPPAAQRPTGDTGSAPKLLTPVASTPTMTNPPVTAQAPKPPQQQTLPPAQGKFRKPRSGRNH